MINDPKKNMAVIQAALNYHPGINSAVFNLLRILKAKNPGDTYYENYLYHLSLRPDSFTDFYHLLWTISAYIQPKKCMEIGTRTGISTCQLLAPMMSHDGVEVHSFDLFNDGFISPEIVKMNLRALNIPTSVMKFYEGDSRVTVPAFFESEVGVLLDYILVDGCHDKDVARTDLENVTGHLATGGLLLFDDIAPDGCNLIDVWDSYRADHRGEFLFIENMDGKGIGVGVKL